MSTTRAGLVLRHVRGLARPAEDDRLLLERFTQRRDEPAFAELVRRHGPMVLGVCRRVLRDAHAADDTFQATFLVLARKADSIDKAESVGGWLYRVAYRAAVRARKQGSDRRTPNGKAPPRAVADPLDEVTGRELLAVLDEELARLPRRHRAPLVLCYLEGRTRDEAAQQLGCPLGTLKRRLEEARDTLRVRLERRGLGLPAALLTAGVATTSVSAAMATDATSAAVRTASAEAAPVLVRGADLVARTLQVLTAGRRKTVAALLAAGLLAAVAGLLGSDRPADEPRARTTEVSSAEQPAPPARGEKETWAVAGQVRDADDKAVPGASVAVIGVVETPFRGRIGLREHATLAAGKADRDGRFRLSCAADVAARAGRWQVIASAPGHGLGGQLLQRDAAQGDIVVKLAAEQVIRGRLIDLQGLPAREVRLHVAQVAPASGSGSATTGSVGGGGGSGSGTSSVGAPDQHLPLLAFTSLPRGLDAWPAAVTTDAEGRFTVRGLGKDRTVTLRVTDDRFARQRLFVRTTAEGKPEAFQQVLEPPHLLEGRVVGEDTGKPIGKKVLLEVNAPGEQLQVWAGEDGRFRVPCPPGPVTVEPYPPDGSPYLTRFEPVAWPKGKVKHEVEVTLPRGVLVRGKVIEVGTSTPVAGAVVSYHVREDNPLTNGNVMSWKRHPGEFVRTKADGTFEATVYPGPGTLLAKGPSRDYVPQRLDTKELALGKPGGAPLYAEAFAPLDLKAEDDGTAVVLKLQRGVTVQGRVLDADGKPVTAAVIYHARSLRDNGDAAHWFHYNPEPVPVNHGVLTLTGLDPRGKLPIFVFDRTNETGARIVLSARAAGEEVKIKLQPCGRVTARFLDPDGKPLKGRTLDLQLVLDADAFSYLSHAEALGGRARGSPSDAEGRTTVFGLIPGAAYSWWDGKKRHEFTAETGKTRELPDIVVPRPRR